MDSEAVRYTFEEAERKFGICYVVYKKFPSVNIFFSSERKCKVLGIDPEKAYELQPQYAVKTVLSGTLDIESNSDVVLVCGDRTDAVKKALSFSNNSLKDFLDSEKKWLKQLHSYAVTTIGGLYLLKSYRTELNEAKCNINKLLELSKNSGDNSFFSLENVFVSEPETFIVYNDYQGDFHYFNAGYEHNGLPQYFKLYFKKAGYKIVDEKYYPHYKLKSFIDYEGLSAEHKNILSFFGITYCYDENYNGHKNTDDVLFTFDARTKVYKAKEALNTDIERFSNQTIKRLKQFSNIATRL